MGSISAKSKLFTEKETVQPLTIDDLAIQVSKDENCEFSFTNKHSAYWYGRTHQDHFREWFAGWNISTRRVLSDYSLSIDGQPLLRAEADSTTVAPDGIVRQWPQAKEQMRMIESVNPAVLVDSGLIVLLILSAKLVIIPQKLYYMAVFPTIFKYLMGDFPYYDLGKTTPQIRQNPFEMP